MPTEKYKLFESLIEAIQIITPEWTIAYLNPSSAQQYNSSVSELLGKKVFDVLADFKGSHIESLIKKTLLNGTNIDDEISLPKGDKNKWYELKLRPVDEGVLFIMLDITERKNKMREVKELNQRLRNLVNEKTSELEEALEREKALNKLQGNFLSMIAHELKAPLNSIKVCLEVLDKEKTFSKEETYEKYNKYIHEEINNLQSLVTEFVTPSNKIISELTLKKEPTSVKETIHFVSQSLERLTSDNQTIIHTHSGDDNISVCKNIFKRILLNLISNALKYSEKDVLIVSHFHNNVLKISIEDQGIGIPFEEHEKVFSKFFRAKNATDVMGTGLGLNIVKTYVEMLGGSIEFESREDIGTTFYIDLPIKMS